MQGRILFICSGNSGRSQMAEALALGKGGVLIQVASAGDARHQVHPLAREAAKQAGLNLPEYIPNTIEEVANQEFDVVVTLCNQVLEKCPTFPGSPARIHWGLPDPSKARHSGDPVQPFREVLDLVAERVNALFQQDFLNSILKMRQRFGALLDNLTDGVMAHDLNRRIFFFNRAAQKITGRSYGEVIGRDCHEVFEGFFCGGNCSFCDSANEMTENKLHYHIDITREDGDIRRAEMSVVPMFTSKNEAKGAIVIFRDVTEVNQLIQRLEGCTGFHGIIGRAPKMLKVYDAIQDLADVDVPVLVQGESGTGKEMVARSLHAQSKRAGMPFVAINCGALPEGILESELFGHVRGAFTGAIRDKKGQFELADGGTLFLDEIGEIAPAMQVKLLRVLQEKTFTPVGGEKEVKVNVRIVSASNKDLKTLTQKGIFREDLYYRLAVIPINLPSLRERSGDITLLAEHFTAMMEGRSRIGRVRISHRSMDLLMKYKWPGNVRELRNAVQYGLIQCKGNTLEPRHLPTEIMSETPARSTIGPGRKAKLSAKDVQEALSVAGSNKAKAARLLGVSRTTLYRYLSNKSV